MKELSRIWILMLGIAVAVIIAIAAYLYNDSSTAFSVTPPVKKPIPAAAPSVLIKKVIEKIDLALFLR
jgi:hypothetical protein